MRDTMLERADSVIVYYAQRDRLQDGFLDEWLEAALVETDNPKAGDYLRWHYRYIYAQGVEVKYSNGVYQYTIQLTFVYYTTAEQEKALDQEVSDIMEKIGISESLMDYENAKKIYDYICANITYDFDNLEDASYTLKYSAYAAMVNKTAVCQGYATLFYYMAREAGLDVRIIAGDTIGGAHAWNIVRLGSVYYYLDSTWDSVETENLYFLKGSDSFTDHVSFDMYSTNEFTSAYPISKTDYVSPSVNGSSIHAENFEVVLEHERVQYHDFRPGVTVTYQGDILEQNKDYKLQYTVGGKSWIDDGITERCVEAIGDASVSVIGLNNYYGQKIVEFEVVKFDLENATLRTPDGEEMVLQDMQYDGTPKIQQGFYVCDNKGTINSSFYGISYKNNVNYGMGIIEITGKGDYYTGKLVKSFYIYKAPITDLTIELPKDKYVYDGNVKTPSVTVTTPNGTRLVEGVDYWITYDQNRIDVGTYYVKVTIDNNYRGAIRLYFDIVPQGEWVQDRVGWWYKRADGTYPYGGWELIGDDWYYFDASGYRVTGWIYSGGVWYYLMEQGTNRPETEGIPNPDVGKMLHSVWFGDKDGNKYYFQANGAMTTGWFYYNQDWYYFNSSGALQTGWELINGTWYYFEEYGEMVTGWRFIGGAWYYFNGSGAMVTGWQLIGGTWYYLHGSGAMAANQWVGNYYLQADGSMAVNKRIGVYYVGADGAWIPGV